MSQKAYVPAHAVPNPGAQLVVNLVQDIHRLLVEQACAAFGGTANYITLDWGAEKVRSLAELLGVPLQPLQGPGRRRVP